MKVVLFANTDWYLWNFRRSTISALVTAGHNVLLLSPSGPYGELLRHLGAQWQPLPMDRRSLNPVRELGLFLFLVRLFRREKVVLVHSFTVKCAVYGSLAARVAAVPARISAVAGLGYVFLNHSGKARFLRPLVRYLLKIALGGANSRLILQNPDDVALFSSAGLVDAGNIRLIPGSGVNCDRFYPDDARKSGARMRVLLAARLLWDKGVAEFVNAARILQREGYAIDFLVAGSPDHGNPDSVTNAEMRSWVDEGVINWLGHVDDIAALFRTVDVVTLPTAYGEGLPKSLIEAAASGCALITTDMPGCREVVEHEVDGLLVPVRDGEALARSIARLHDDPMLRARLADAGRRKALERFDERIVVRDTLAVYRELGVVGASAP